MSSQRFSGRTSTNPEFALRAAERLGILLNALEGFGSQLGPEITQSAPRTVEHRQRDNHTCFYASLIGIRMAILPEAAAVSEANIAGQAEAAGVLGPLGAETWPEFQDQQIDFVRSNLGLNIRFIDAREGAMARIEALTAGLKDQGNPIVFGTSRHWLALDGFLNNEEGLAWIGMNPGSGRRLEDSGQTLSPQTILARLTDSGLPLVVVEGAAEAAPRFRPAAKRFRPVGRSAINTANEPPRFRPTPTQK